MAAAGGRVSLGALERFRRQRERHLLRNVLRQMAEASAADPEEIRQVLRDYRREHRGSLNRFLRRRRRRRNRGTADDAGDNVIGAASPVSGVYLFKRRLQHD